VRVSASGGPTSPRDALAMSAARTNAERIVAFGAYLSEVRGQEPFTAGDIKMLFRQARLAVPRRFDRDLEAAISFGWLGVDDERIKEYYVTDGALRIFATTFEPLRAVKPSSSGMIHRLLGHAHRMGRLRKP
jgi:hypothetical protein